MSYSLIDCYNMRKKTDGPIFSTYRKITDSFKSLIHIQFNKDSKERIDEIEAKAAVDIIISVIDYVERFCVSRDGNKKGLNYAMDIWANSRLQEESKGNG